MGINRPSLYAAFGNKQSLFKKVLHRYATGPASYFTPPSPKPTARAVAEKLLHGGIKISPTPATPAAASCRPGRPRLRRRCRLRAPGTHPLTAKNPSPQIRKRLAARQKRRRSPPQYSNPADLARYLATLMHGLAVQSASGASLPQLRRIANLALKAWPS
jgi:AcrR family transcriptional regulator